MGKGGGAPEQADPDLVKIGGVMSR